MNKCNECYRYKKIEGENLPYCDKRMTYIYKKLVFCKDFKRKGGYKAGIELNDRMKKAQQFLAKLQDSKKIKKNK